MKVSNKKFKSHLCFKKRVHKTIIFLQQKSLSEGYTMNDSLKTGLHQENDMIHK